MDRKPTDMICKEHGIQLDSPMRPRGGTIIIELMDVVDILNSMRCPVGDEACEPTWYWEEIPLLELQATETFVNWIPAINRILGLA